MSVTVRRAIEADTPWLLSQLRAFSASYGTRRSLFPEDLDHARQILSTLIEQHLFLVAEHEAGLIGFVGGFFFPHPFNPTIRTLVEQFYWVAPECRGSIGGTAALQLLNDFLEAGEQHAHWIVFTREHGSTLSERHLLKRGFRPLDHQYLKEVS